MDDSDTVPQGSISPNVRDLYTIGVNLPNQTHAKGTQYAFNEAEIDRMADDYATQFSRGNYIRYLDEHAPDKSIGEIVMLFRNRNGDMGCLGHISDTSNAGRTAIHNAVLQFSGGMSAGLSTGVKDDHSTFVPIQKPVYRSLEEVSITSTPCFNGTTHIKYVSDDASDVLTKIARLAGPNGAADPSRAIARLPASLQSFPQLFADQAQQGRRFELPSSSSPSYQQRGASLADSRSAVSMMSTFFSRVAQQQKSSPTDAFGGGFSHFFVPESGGAHFSQPADKFGAHHNYSTPRQNSNSLANKRSLRVVRSRFSEGHPASIRLPEAADLDIFALYQDVLVSGTETTMSALDPAATATPAATNAAPAAATVPPTPAQPASAATAIDPSPQKQAQQQQQPPVPTPLNPIPHVTTPVIPAATGAPAAAPATSAPPAATPSQQQPSAPTISKEAKLKGLGSMQDEALDFTVDAAAFLNQAGLKNGKDLAELMARVKRVEASEANLAKQQQEAAAEKAKLEEAKKISDANKTKADIADTLFASFANMDLSKVLSKEDFDLVTMVRGAAKITDRFVTDAELAKVAAVSTTARAFQEDQRAKENIHLQQAQWAYGRSAGAQSIQKTYDDLMATGAGAQPGYQQSSAQQTPTPQQQQQPAGGVPPSQQQPQQPDAQQQQLPPPQQPPSQVDFSEIQRVKTVASAIPGIETGSPESVMAFIKLLNVDNIPIGSTSFMGINCEMGYEKGLAPLPFFTATHGDSVDGSRF